MRILKKAVVDACSQTNITCEYATNVILGMLTGQRGDTCDIVSLLYEKDLSYKTYRGIKDQFMSGVAYLFKLSSLGMGLQAAKVSINSNEPSHWQFTQERFQLAHRTALYRIQDFYQIAVNETVHNSQINLITFIKYNPDLFSSNSFENVTQGVQYALETVAPNKEWFVQVYEARNNDYNQYQGSRCVDCFTIFGVNGTYHIFIAGVDSTSIPNPAV